VKPVFVLSLLLALPLMLSAAGKPNVVFFLVDDFSAGALSAFGSDLHETPNIDQLAARGAVFTQGYAACTVCSPSRAAIDWIAGHVGKARGKKLLLPDWKMFMEHSELTLAEALKEQGYATGFFGKWHLIPHKNPEIKDRHFPEDHGFDINIGGCEWGQPKGKGKYFHPFNMPNMNSEPGDFLTDRLTDYAVDFIEEKKDEPFLLYFSYYTVHGPVMGKPELVEKYKAKLASGKYAQRNPAYAAMVESLDESVGRVLATLDAEGLRDNTLIIFTGDNGAAFHAYTAGLRERKAYSYEGGVREPCFISGLGIPAGKQIDTPVIGMDFYPTILDMIGAPLKPEQHQDGVSLKPLLLGQGSIPDRSLYWHYPHYHRTTPYGAIQSGDYKLIEFYEDGRRELYDLNKDPFEQNNLAASSPEKVDELWRNLKLWRRDVGAQMMELNPDYTPEKQLIMD
jgi:arylsulfatase A-like enzyme